MLVLPTFLIYWGVQSTDSNLHSVPSDPFALMLIAFPPSFLATLFNNLTSDIRHITLLLKPI